MARPISGSTNSAAAVSATKKAGTIDGSVDAAGRLPAAEPDEGKHAERHCRDEGDDRKIDGRARADIEQRPQPGADKPALISSFQSRSRAIKAAAASTIAMKPNSAQWFGACDETSTGVT